MNWNYILEDVKNLEKKIDLKIDRLISQNLNPFPFERIQKGKELRALCRAIKKMINDQQEDDARYLLDVLKEKGGRISRQ